VKLAAERFSSQTDRLLLAAFRQAVQALRESIREGRNLDFPAQPYLQGQSQAAAQARLLGYRAFKALSAYVATMLSSSSAGPPEATRSSWWRLRLSPSRLARPSSSQAAEALVAVTATAGLAPRWWEIAERELHLPVIPQH
jgi:hypothetical protein